MKSYKSVTVGNGLPISPLKTFAFTTRTNQAREEGENEDLNSDVDALLDSADEYGCCHEEGALQARKKKGRKATLPSQPSNGRPGQGMSSVVMVNTAQHEQAQKQRAAKLKRRTSTRTMENLRRAKNAAQQARVASPGLISPCAAGIAAFRPVSPVPSTIPAPICAAAAVPSIRVLQYYPVNAVHLSDAVAKACQHEEQPLPASPEIPVTSNKFEVLGQASLECEDSVKEELIAMACDTATGELSSPMTSMTSPTKEQERRLPDNEIDSDCENDGQLEPVEEFGCNIEDSVAFKGTRAIKWQPVVRGTNASGVPKAKAALAAGRRQLTAAKRVADKANYQNVRALRLSKQGLVQNGLGSPIRCGLRPCSAYQSPAYVPATGRSGISLAASAEAAAPFDAAAVPSFGIVEDDMSAVILDIEGSPLFAEEISSIYGIPLTENSFAVLAEDEDGELMPPTPSPAAPAAEQKRRREGVMKRGLRLVGGIVGRLISGAVAVVKTVGKAVKRVLSRRS